MFMIYITDSGTFVWSFMGSIWKNWWNDLDDKFRKVINNWQNRKGRKRKKNKNKNRSALPLIETTSTSLPRGFYTLPDFET